MSAKGPMVDVAAEEAELSRAMILVNPEEAVEIATAVGLRLVMRVRELEADVDALNSTIENQRGLMEAQQNLVREKRAEIERLEAQRVMLVEAVSGRRATDEVIEWTISEIEKARGQ